MRERQVDFINSLNNRVRKRYYCDDSSEINDVPAEENDQIYAINDDQLYQVELIDDEQILSGDVVSFQGRNNTKIEDLTINVSPVQSGSGDPSPDNVRPISGWAEAYIVRTGKNIADYTQAKPWKNTSNVLVEILDNGVHVASKTDGTYRAAIIEIPPLPAGTSWVLSADVVVRVGRAFLTLRRTDNSLVVKSANSLVNRHLRTDPWVSTGEPVAISLFCTYSTSTAGDVDFINIQLECADAESDYAPFSGNTYPVSWQAEAGTVYGGTLDMTTGTLTVKYASETLNSVYYFNKYTNYYLWFLRHPDTNPKYKLEGNALSDIFAPRQWLPGHLWTGTETAYIGVVGPDQSLTTQAQANAWMANHPAQVVFELETPITYQLTPVEIRTLLGRNNIWADCGSMNIDVLTQGLNVFLLAPPKN